MHPRFQLLRLLADGRFHSGRALGDALGLSRGSVWNLARELDGLGVEVFAVRGKGYQLTRAFEPLDADRMLVELPLEARSLLADLEVHPSVDSTNRVLHQRADQGAPSGTVCLAEHQSQGRGRRGRGWVSPYGANLYASLLWRFDQAPAALGPLSVAVGVMIAEALEALGAQGCGLKWPNDVLWSGGKLAGVLIEMTGEATGPAQAVVGVGLNVAMPDGAGAEIDQPWVDLSTVLGRPVDRNVVASAVLARLLSGLERFAREGFAPLRASWDRLDVARGRPVRVASGAGVLEGECLGLDTDGALLVASGGRVQRCLSGEVSVRLVA